jgi:amino acid adenylation domain-containing protein/thioester reductase-like protein/non-ribosomal peptide synthase protein (TIGR01720 family)
MQHKEYWLERLAGDIEKSSFPHDHKTTVLSGRIIETLSFALADDLFHELMEQCGTSGNKLYKILSSVLVVLLDKYAFTGNKDIIIGAPILKESSDKEPVNSVVALRNLLHDNMTFAALLARMGQTLDEAYEHKDYPIDLLLDRLDMTVTEEGFPLFDVAILLENLHTPEHLEALPLNIVFSFVRTDNELQGTVKYNSTLYAEETIRRLVSHYVTLLESSLADETMPLCKMNMLSSEEKKQVLFTFNNLEKDYPKDKTIHQMFELNVEKMPGNVALSLSGESLTYEQFNGKVNQLARVLREKGIRIENIVGVMTERSIEMIIAIYAILKAGGAYLPIDPDYPEDRIRYLINDSGSSMILTQARYVRFAEGLGFEGEVINLEDSALYRGDYGNLGNENSPTDLAYIIYTSGSTGNPKGVMIEHVSAVNLLLCLYDKYPLNEGDTYLLKTAFLFDVSVSEIFGWFWGGGRLAILEPGGEKDPLMMLDVIEEEKITHLNFVPSMFNLFVNVLSEENSYKLAKLRYVFLAGEAIWADSIIKFRYLKTRVTIENIYGPTEATVYASWYPVGKWNGVGSISIGRPIDNLKLYILASRDNDNPGIQPMGVAGELAISGIQLARGYLNRPELTAEKFIDNPLVEEEGWDKSHRKLYRTGDLCRWDANGDIEYNGRIDYQVKIRGFRIETGEIETKLSDLEVIKEAIVMAREDGFGEKYLCAYLLADEKLDISAIRDALAEEVPEYMVPTYFVQLTEIPLTPTGKVNRKALPNPEITEREEDYVSPRNETEKKLAGIWSEILNIDRDIISIDDNFFTLGGHSLKAAIMIAMIHKTFNVRMAMKEAFDFNTIRKLAKHLKMAKEDKYSSITPAPLKEYYPQSSAQKRLYFMGQLEKNSILYNIPLMDIYHKGTNKERLEEALRKLIKRHESLRTSFHTIEGEAVQKIHHWKEIARDFGIEYYETQEDGMIYSEMPGKEWTQVTGLPFQDVVEHFVRPFDLSKAPLLRVGLINIAQTLQILMVDIHHIVADGVTLVLLVDEIWGLYDGKELPSLPIQYKDYAEWSNSEEQLKRVYSHEDFWIKEFEGEISPLNLPTDYPRPAKMTFEGDSLHFEFSIEQTRALNHIAQEQGTTLYMVLLALYNVLLSKLSSQEEIIIGTVTAGRNHAELQNIIGMFVETLAVRNFPIGEKTFKTFLHEVKERSLSALEHQEYPFEELVKKVATRQDTSRNPLFDVVFNLENESDQIESLLEILMLDKFNPYRFQIKKSKFDMTLVGIEAEYGLQFSLEYNTSLFKANTVERFIRYFKTIVDSACRNIDREINLIEFVPELEKNLVLYQFNNTDSDYPREKTIHELIEEQVLKTPDNEVIVGAAHGDWGTRLTYRRMNEKSNQLARLLRSKGIKPDSLAAVLIEPCQEMIIGLVAILKAGGAFLPIKDGTPVDRISYIMKDSQTRFLLTRLELLGELSFDGEIIYLDDNNIFSGDTVNPALVNGPEDIAYVIYTSGSTGKPKGVIVEHRNLANLCFWHNKVYLVTSRDHATKYAGFGFDASVWEIFPYLVKGASIYIVPDEIQLDIDKLNAYFEENNITISFLPTQVCEQFMTLNNTSLRVLLTGGDKLKSFEPNDYYLVNNYGPTENTVVTTSFNVDKISANIPIGRPLHNNQIYIVSKYNSLQPVGVPGELCIGGDSVARGYLNNPELTKEKFVDNPFFPYSPYMTPPPLYRSGDLARWLPDGNIEFLGRIDYQVKIRGFRIELGEIENQLLHHESVKEAVVIAREDSPGAQKYLCAYVIPEDNFDIEAIKSTLAAKMPDYMVPAFFVEIESIPLTPNGKIDIRALPAPGAPAAAEYKAPTNEIEELLVETWSKVLGIEKIGIDDNFFELGGDSIKTILISSKLLTLQLNINVNDFFIHPTIRKLARTVKHVERSIDQGAVSGHVELIPIQKWFFRNHLPYCEHFNQSVLLFRQKEFNEAYVETVFKKIVLHHDALRMVYAYSDDPAKMIQENRGNDDELFDFEAIRLTSTVEEIEAEIIKQESNRIQQSFDLKSGPLVKLKLFKGNTGDYLLIVIHHLVVDGVSWRVIIEDFETGYRQAEVGEEVQFQDKTDSFQYWARRLSEFADSQKLLKQLEFWKTIEDTDVKPLPVDYQVRDDQRTFSHIDFVTMSLSKDKTDLLMSRVNRAYNTEINDILLTALGLTVKQWSGDNKVLINLEGHGRELVVEEVDISRTVGWFTTQYPVILNMSRAEDISFSIKDVKETLRRIPFKGIGHGILKFMTPPGKKESIQFRQEPDIVFNYLGQLGGEDYDVIDRMSEISDPCTGDSIAPGFVDNFKIDIEGITIDGRLKLDFFYHKNEYRRITIENVAKMMEVNLEKVIGHCAAKEEKESTPSDLGYSIISIDDLERINRYISDNIGEDMEIQSLYPLSPMQSGMLFHALKNRDSLAYFEQSVITLQGDLDKSLLEDSLNKLIDRYDILRTVFAYEELEEPLQIVLKQRKTHLYFYEDISHLEEEKRESYLEEIREKDQERGFDLVRDFLIRFCLLKTGATVHQLVLSFHHTLMDGWCLGIILDELRQIYRSFKKKQPVELELATPYIKYINWLVKQDSDEALSYWEEHLADYEHAAVLPKIGQLSKDEEYQHEEYHFVIEENLMTGINKMSAKSQVTINTVFQALWGILLHRYNNSNDVVYGTIVSGRPSEIEGVERMVGLFINMIPVRIRSIVPQTFSQLLKIIQKESLTSKEYEYLTVADIQSRTSLKGDLIDHIMIFENYPVQDELKKGETKYGFIIEKIKIYEQTNYDFNIIIMPWDHLYVNFSYNSLVYDKEIIEHIALHFEKIIEQVLANPDVQISDIEILSEKERRKVLFDFNETKVSYPFDRTIHQLFEAQVEKTPGNIAVVFKDKQLKYNELNERANQLAGILRKNGVRPDGLVGIMANRSSEMIVALLAVLKAGGAYVPIDPEYPVDRVEYMINDSDANFLLTQGEVMGKFKDSRFKAQSIDILDERLYGDDEGKTNLENKTSPHDLAYAIYTSGSTGKPKGVAIRHRNAVNFFKGMTDRIDFSAGKIILAVTTLCFDIFLLETLLPVTYGLKLVIADEIQQKDPEVLWEVIASNHVNLLQLTPSRLKLLLSHSDISYLEKIEDILVGGEAFPRNLFEELKEKYNGNIIDVYGPTETTVWSTIRDLTGQDEINIGTPIANTQIYILDKFKRLQPIGVIGELYIGGDGVARGYLNRTELTDERFVDNPYDEEEGLDKSYRKIYNTGDLARWLPDGNIDFLGRVDHQVKIRGFRIETGEIEAQILKREEVKEAVVIAREDTPGEKYLCAYIVPLAREEDGGQELSVASLRDYLLKELPDYMMPSFFILVEKIPLTPNGKVDRKALIKEGQVMETGMLYTPPRNDVEELMAEMWGSVLKVERVGIHDNFFELGGNSLKAIQLVSHMVKNFDVKIGQIFKYKTVAELAENILFKRDNMKEKIEEMRKSHHLTREEEDQQIYLKNQLEIEKKKYSQNIGQETWEGISNSNDYKCILLTGATGFLGAHLVPELLAVTNAELFLLVRGSTGEDAENRLRKRLNFYFGDAFFDKNRERIQVVKGDLKKDNLGLSTTVYESLVNKVDAVVHSAANVRHVGLYEDFYEDNVAATERLLNFSITGNAKDFHFISTTGVCSGTVKDETYTLFTEYRQDFGQVHENVYARTKFEAEKLVVDFRKKGINTSIYRMGFLVCHSQTGKFQENIEENAFYANLKAFMTMGVVSDNWPPAELSFIDLSARTVALLMKRRILVNEIFHLKNHHLVNWTRMGIFLKELGIDMHVISHDQFIDYLHECVEDDKKKENVNRFLLNLGFFESMDEGEKSTMRMTESLRTVKILELIGFQWPIVTLEHIKKMILHGKEVGFFE